MLQIEDVSVRFGDLSAVDGVDLELSEGQVLAVLGPSGCGKSTLLRAIAGLERLATGRIRWRGEDLAGVPTHQRHFALMFQDGQLFPHASVAENIAYPLRLRRISRGMRAARVAELLELVNLPDYGPRRPATLSGGERQRVALARALAADPQLLLLDEPLSALDRGLRERLAGDLRDILVTTGTTAIMVTHDHDEAFTVADRMAVMLAGQVVQEDETSQLWRSPADEQVASFIGYGTILTGAAAEVLSSHLPPGADSQDPMAGEPSAIALRRSALRVDSAGPLVGVVQRAVTVSDAVHLEVDIADIGSCPALAQDIRIQAGQQVTLAVDPAGVAWLPRRQVLGKGV